MTTQARELAGIISNAGDLNFSDDITLGSDAAVLNFGADSEVTVTHVHNTGLLLNSTRQLQFGDSGTYINQSADGVLNITSDTEVEINATLVDLNGNLDVSGNIVLAGTITVGDADDDNMVINANVNSHIIPNTDDTFDLGSTGLQWRNLYVDGTAYLDVIDFNGTAITATAAEINIIDGDTSATSTTLVAADRLIVNDAGTIKQVALSDFETFFESDLDTFTTITTSTSLRTPLIEFTDGDDAIVIADGGGVTIANFTGTGNLTGNVTGSSGSSTGNAATATALATARTIHGVSFDGTANIDLSEVVQDTVGAMFTSNTETNITATYEDGDGTIDLVVGNTTGNAATSTEATNITAVANNSTDETVYLTFVDGATGTQGLETDTGLTYNPSSGLLTTTLLAGTLNTAAQTNITSLGTLSSLAVSGNQTVGGTLGLVGNLNFTATNGMSITAQESLVIDIDLNDNDSSRVFTVRSGAGGSAETLIQASEDAGVTLYYDNAAKLATVTGGVTVTGTLTATTLAGTLSTAAQTAITSVGTLSSLAVGNITTTGYIRGPSSFTIDPATHGDNTGTLVIAGNLQVDGTTTTINSTTLTVDDLKITVAEGAGSSSAANEAGIEVGVGAVGASSNPSILYTHATTSWDMNKPLNVTGAFSASGNITGTLATAAQTNITSVGTLSSLAVSGNQTVGGTLGVTGETTLSTHLNMGDSDVIKIGANADLQLYHDGNNSHITNNYGVLYIDQLQDDGNMIFRSDDGSGGLDEYIVLDGGGGGVRLKHYDDTKLVTNSGGIAVTGTAILGGASFVDNATAYFGTDLDLRIYHDSNNSYIKDSGTGALRIAGSQIILRNAADSGHMLNAVDGGAVSLYHNTSARLETTSGGVSVTGNITTSATLSSFTDRIKIINGSAQLNIGQWDGSNHRIEADANRPLTIQSYNSTGISLGISGSNKLVINGNGANITGILDVKDQIKITNADNNTVEGLKGTRFGYSTAYKVLQIGGAASSTSNNIAIGVDLSGNASGSFTGYGEAIYFRNGIRFRTPNTANNGWHEYITLNNGKVGIGDNVPLDYLEINGSGSGIGGLTISNSTHNHAALSFARSAVATARIFTSEPGATHTSAMHFQTGIASGPALVTAMTIDENQQVGIGTTDPSELLTLKAASTEETMLLFEDNSATDIGTIGIHPSNGFVIQQKVSGASVHMMTHDGNEDINLDSDGFIQFEAAGAEKMRITSTGVGIGNDSPDHPLVIKSNTGASAVKLIGRDADSVSSIALTNSAVNAESYLQSNGHWFRARANEGFHWRADNTPTVTDTDGFTIEDMNLGVGTASPAKILEVSESVDGSKLRLSRPGVGAWDFFMGNTSTLTGVGSGALELKPTNGNHYFAIGQAGTTTALLHVKNTGIYVVAGAEANVAYGFNDDSDTGMFKAAANTLAFGTGGTERIRINSSGIVGIGTTATGTNAKLNVAGGINYTHSPASAAGLNVVAQFSFNNSNTANACGSVYYKMFMLNIYHNNGHSQALFLANGGGGVGYRFTSIEAGSSTIRNGVQDFSMTTIGSSPSTYRIQISNGGGALTVSRTSGSNSFQVTVQVLTGG